jgi:hypothetical protein
MEIPKTTVDNTISELYELIDWLEPLRKPNIPHPSTHVAQIEQKIRGIAATLLHWRSK